MQENRLFSGQIYTGGTDLTRPPVATVVTNLNYAHMEQRFWAPKDEIWSCYRYICWLPSYNIMAVWYSVSED